MHGWKHAHLLASMHAQSRLNRRSRLSSNCSQGTSEGPDGHSQNRRRRQRARTDKTKKRAPATRANILDTSAAPNQLSTKRSASRSAGRTNRAVKVAEWLSAHRLVQACRTFAGKCPCRRRRIKASRSPSKSACWPHERWWQRAMTDMTKPIFRCSGAKESHD